jgi:hypothetical protein
MKTIIEAEMREYLDGAYADSGTARNQLLYFAELVTEQANARANNSWALMCKKMVEAEREACAKVAEDMNRAVLAMLNVTSQPKAIAAAIRARGNT